MCVRPATNILRNCNYKIFFCRNYSVAVAIKLCKNYYKCTGVNQKSNKIYKLKIVIHNPNYKHLKTLKYHH